MNYRELGTTGLKVSELGFGALEIGRDWPYWRKDFADFARPNEPEGEKILLSAFDHGINFFDTAPAYFRSEEILGRAFKGRRQEVIIATKCGEWFDGHQSVYDYSAAETTRFIDNSLRLLRTDYIDVLQIHSAPVEVVQRGETLDAMTRAREAGKVRFLGLSTEEEEAARLAMTSGGFDAIQFSHNLLRRSWSEPLLELARQHHVGVIVKDALATGRLTEKFPDLAGEEERRRVAAMKSIADRSQILLAEMALRFSLTSDAVSTVIAGTKNGDHLAANLRAVAAGPLPSGILHDLSEL